MLYNVGFWAAMAALFGAVAALVVRFVIPEASSSVAPGHVEPARIRSAGAPGSVGGQEPRRLQLPAHHICRCPS
jgi:hypothetical protein